VIWGLPYAEIWCVDFEFTTGSGDQPGALPEPVCMVAWEIISGRLIRLWRGEFGPRPPFRTDEQVLFVAFYASAEIGCFLALGWDPPARILDLYAEFRNESNGLARPLGNGLLAALAWHGIGSITKDEKTDTRALILRGGPWDDAERARIMGYCQSDVDVLGPLLERMLPGIRARRHGLGQALMRGRYMTAVARMERAGIPVDVPLLAELREKWDLIRERLVQEVDADYGVYDGITFKAGLFAAWCVGQGITWPLLDSGYLDLKIETFRDMARRYPQLVPLKELRASLGELRMADLAVGPDGRNRVLLSPFGTKTGRNAPSNSKSVFGPATWIRGLIKPDQGRAVAYIDWSAQEVAIAAVLSGDQALLDSVASGDPYLAFAVRAGLAPAGATKETHGLIRDACKTAILGANYGMQWQSLAARTGLAGIEAQAMLHWLTRIYPDYDQWARASTDTGLLGGVMRTAFGWTYHVQPGTRPRTLRNFPMQSGGAEMMRLACCLATERGVTVCCPVHDALLVEADDDQIGDVVEVAEAAMAEASRLVLSGYEIGNDAVTVRWPGRYADKRGVAMWTRVTGLLQAEAHIR
jgi:DNA polymerase I